VREPRVLVLHKHLEGAQVGRAVVVDEPGDVAVRIGVDAVCFASVLEWI
jgi:hypothetical protein